MTKRNNKGKKRKGSSKKVDAKEVDAKKVDAKKAMGDGEEITWDDIAAISDSEDEDDIDEAVEKNLKAKNLRQAITSNLGSLLNSLKKQRTNNENGEEEDGFEEDFLDASSLEDDEGDNTKVQENDFDEHEQEQEENDDHREKSDTIIDQNKDNNNDGGDSDSESSNDGEGDKNGMEKYKRRENSNNMNSKALSVVTAELTSAQSKRLWAETFVIAPPTPLPFGVHGDPDSNPLDIHDDLKREVAFYNTALEAANLARSKCHESDIPFSRPEDFFAEMVKDDDHMAKVKDRLIFENKKIEAVAQRKSNKEQKLRAKESQANRLAEKAKRKRDHFQEVKEWANSAARNRGGALRDDTDDNFLSNRKYSSGPSKKRQAADRRFGFGGKRGRFKQNDRQSMNDMSGFNPRGNFAEGMKRSAKNKKDRSGSGASRAGKRARDAKRTKRQSAF